MGTIEIIDVGKDYGGVSALSGIHLSIRRGELFGLIGPDGAGKTTLFKILTSLLIPDRGRAVVAGLDVVQRYKQVRKIIGYMPGTFSLYQDLTVEENLRFFATIFGTTIRENYHLIEDIYKQIEPFKRRRAGNLSGGMKQKLALCCALIHEPEVLFLDEPTTGVDAVSRVEFWEMLHRLREKEMTIMVSTPYMDEANQCQRIALIQEGRILRIDTPEGIVESFSQTLYATKSADFYRLLVDLRQAPFIESVEPFGEFLHLTTSADIRSQQIEEFARHRNHRNIVVQTIDPTIEDVFLHLMREAA